MPEISYTFSPHVQWTPPLMFYKGSAEIYCLSEMLLRPLYENNVKQPKRVHKNVVRMRFLLNRSRLNKSRL